MLYFRALVFLITILLIVYYSQVVLHILGVTNITDKRINFIKCMIPFYFWLNN